MRFKDADDCNDDQQFDEGEAFCIFMCWMLLHDHFIQNLLENDNFIGTEICVENKVR